MRRRWRRDEVSTISRVIPQPFVGPIGVWHSAYRFNKTRSFWKHLIRRRMPFVKIELILLDTMGVGEDAILERLRAATDYPVELTERYLHRTRRY